jgi:hypothetical protein
MEGHQFEKRVGALACGLVLLVGCTARPQLHPFDASHPAHVAAPEGIVREPSALTRDALGSMPEPSGSTGHHHHGAGAGHAH